MALAAHDFVLVFGIEKAVSGRKASSLHWSWMLAPMHCRNLQKQPMKQLHSVASFDGIAEVEKLELGSATCVP